MNSIARKSINAIRVLGIDMIENAGSGHPGIVMGAAPMMYTLFAKHLEYTKKDSEWINRDRFILSAGHGSALLYSTLHLTKRTLTIKDLKEFKTFKSKTPGHPELDQKHGIECSTGPLGQGLAMAIGFAISETMLHAKTSLIDNYTYVIVSDGDMMEGLSHEVASLAGTLKLGKLIVMYDSNDICLDGDLKDVMNDHTMKRFASYGWQTILVKDGENIDDINNAIIKAKENKKQPTLIEIKTIIGYGSPGKQGTNAAHGAPLGKEETKLAKQFYNWNDNPFDIPQDVIDHFQSFGINKEKQYDLWLDKKTKNKNEYDEVIKIFNKTYKVDLKNSLKELRQNDYAIRDASSLVMNEIEKQIPTFVGGSADLFSSNRTYLKNGEDYSAKNRKGKNIWFGVREFGMRGIINGITLHSGLRTYDSTFLAFSDYLKPALRLSALMGINNIGVYSHDSIAVGGDGPTHQPIEQIASLRTIPNLTLFRPADLVETLAAWQYAMDSKDKPSIIVTTRQPLKRLKNSSFNNAQLGGYIVSKESKNIDAIIVASGSEVSLAIEVKQILKKFDKDIRIISMPSICEFERQDKKYRIEIMSQHKNVFTLEMGVGDSWYKYASSRDHIFSIESFGESCPELELMNCFGFNKENIAKKIMKLL